MAILIKNPEVERKARELASLRGQTITAALDGALDKALAEEELPKRRPTLEEMIAATERFRALSGVSGPLPPVTKEEWDEINEVPGFSEDEA
jgi:antitoxin VapB